MSSHKEEMGNDDPQDDKGVSGKTHLTKAELEKLGAELGTPDVRPCDFDQTFNGWLARISTWGEVKIVYTDTEFKEKHEINKRAFIKKVSDDKLLKLMGAFHIERLDINIVELYREYVGIGGLRQRESFMVTVDLKPELKKALE